MPDIGFLDIILILILIPFVLSLLQQRYVRISNKNYINKLESLRESKVITLIQKRRAPTLLGLFFSEKIGIEESEKLLREIRNTPEDKPIDLILHTPGGLVIASEQIAEALVSHEGKVTVFVPHYALSGGTLVALAADEIVMGSHAVLGRIDPQILGLPASSIQKVMERKNIERIDDKTIILADTAEKSLNQIKNFIFELLSKNEYSQELISKIIEELTSGKYTHDHPLTLNKAESTGLRVSGRMPRLVYKILESHPQK